MKKGISVILLVLFFAGQAQAQGASQQFSAGSKNLAQGSGHLIVGGVQGVSAVAAVPFAASGAVGHGSTQVAHDLKKTANKPFGKPLPVSQETIISPSPADAF